MLYDLSGRLVYQMESASIEGNELDLPIANLKNGTYMLQVITNGEQFKKVILKN
ncbi:MAG: T9SS type A sorting domain-containing protein [Bacteroidetes bacterium]|nr:T9SS type A sorting domain-containing protein [Bacteroidota bacterium]